MNNYVFEMLHPWVTHGINMWQLSTKSQYKQQGDHLFSWNRGNVTYHSEHSPSSGRRSRKWCLPLPWSVVSGLLRMNLHFLPSHLLTFNKILLWVTCVRQKYLWNYNSTVRYFVVREGFLDWNSQWSNTMIDECYFRWKDNWVFKMSPINNK